MFFNHHLTHGSTDRCTDMKPLPHVLTMMSLEVCTPSTDLIGRQHHGSQGMLEVEEKVMHTAQGRSEVQMRTVESSPSLSCELLA